MTDECIGFKFTPTRNGGVDKADALGFATESVTPGDSAVVRTAHMPTERYATEYNMNHKRRGQAIIFNHEYYDIPSMTPRKGTNKDCDDLSNALMKLDFQVKVFKDRKLKEITAEMEKVGMQDHSEHDCVLIAVLSHGELGYLFAKDTQYKVDTLTHYLTAQNCPTLAGKPKIFFIQACQGDKVDPGVLMQKTETDGASNMSFKIPVYADFLLAFSTMQGFYSWRNPDQGSWFIQSLVKELNANGTKHDFLTLLTFVNQRVAMDYESHVPHSNLMDKQKQIPCVTTMLTRILRFTDKPKVTN